MDVTDIEINKLKPYNKNAKKHPKKQIEKISNSIKKFGFRNPILLNKENVIIAGHGRLLAAKKLKLKQVPVIYIEDLSIEDIKALRLMDNKSAESDWDLDFLKEEFKELDKIGYDLDLTGWDELEIREMDLLGETKPIIEDEIDVNAYSRAKSKTKIKLGDIFNLENHRLMCADCTDESNVIKLMDGKKVDMVFTDPPYGINIVKDNHRIGFGDGTLGFKNKSGVIGGRGIVPVGVHPKIINDETPFNPKFILEYGDNQIIFGGNYFADKLPPASGWIIWDKRGDIPSNNFADCEIAWASFKKPARIYTHKWSGLIREGARLDELKKRVHPTQKPVGLFTKLLKEYSKDNELIFDLFGGSGSTLIACEQTNRKCYMMEIDPVYCQIIIDRWEKITNKKAKKL